MGARGPIGKPDGARQGHRKGGLAVVPARVSADVQVPAAPREWLKGTKDRWAAYWRSDVALVAGEVDLMAAERLFTYTDEWTRAVRALRQAGRVTTGSVGQVRLSPMVDYIKTLEQAIGRLSSELGLTPLARARLGIAVGQARLTAVEVNRMAQEGDPPEAGTVDVEGWEPA